MLTERSVRFYYKNQTSSIDIFFCILKNRKMLTLIKKKKNSLALWKIQSRKAHIFIFSNNDFITYAD